MADEVEERFKSALETLANIMEVGGYLKKDMKEDMQKAVSVIRSCFTTMKNALEFGNKEEQMHQSEVMESETCETQRVQGRRPARQVATSVGPMHEVVDNSQCLANSGAAEWEEDRRSEGQVAPSGSSTHEAASESEQLPTPSESERNGDDSRGGNTYQRLTPSSGRNHKIHAESEMEEKITEKVNQHLKSMMENISNSIKKMIKEEIENAARQTLVPNPMDAQEGINPTTVAKVVNEGDPRVQRRGRQDPLREVTEIREHVKTTQGSESPEKYELESDPDINQKGGEWTSVVRGRKRPGEEREAKGGTDSKGRIKGTRQGESRLKAAESNAWLYIGRVSPEVTEEDIEEYLRANGVRGRINCRMVSNMDSSRAFKIGIPMIELDRVYEETFWPTNVICRPFRAPWRYKGGP